MNIRILNCKETSPVSEFSSYIFAKETRNSLLDSLITLTIESVKIERIIARFVPSQKLNRLI